MSTNLSTNGLFSSSVNRGNLKIPVTTVVYSMTANEWNHFELLIVVASAVSMLTKIQLRKDTFYVAT